MSPEPAVLPPLDPDFRPLWQLLSLFRRAAEHGEADTPLTFALVRSDAEVSVFRARVFPAAHARAELNFAYAERVLKFLLWQRGARRVLIAGPEQLTQSLADTFAAGGERAFDAEFFEQVYAGFVVEPVSASQIPEARESARSLGGHWDGFRIGFDAGGSDRKVAALIDGREVFSAEVVWQPKQHSDPAYHVAGIEDSIESALRRLPRLDAIGVSSAGIFLENRTRVASLFRKVAPADFAARIENIFPDLAAKYGVPLEVANDGDVAALAGALEIGDGPVLGLALGTSLAAGYVDAARRIHGGLNELAFAPLDIAEGAVTDLEWSGDRGTGAQYLSQDSAARLAERAGIRFESRAPAERLCELQLLMQQGDARARAVYESLGVYLGYAVLGCAEFYALKHVLLLGRVTSGVGGSAMLHAARRVIAAEAPKLADRLLLRVPDEAKRRVGQAIAAASLPRLNPSGKTQ